MRSADAASQRVWWSVSRRRRGASGARLEVGEDGGDHPRLGFGAIAHRRGHDEAAMTRVRAKQAGKPHAVSSRTRHQGGEASHEVEWLDEIAGSDFELPKADPKGGGQDARNSSTCMCN